MIFDVFNDGQTQKKFEQLYGQYDGTDKYIRYRKKRNRMCLLIAIISIVAGIAVWLYEKDNESEQINSIIRNDPGGGAKSTTLIATFDKLDKKEKITVSVSEKQYSEDEISKYADKLEDELADIIVGNNTSMDHVTQTLNLVSNLEGYPFTISWKVDKPLLISNKGLIDYKYLKKELSESEDSGILVTLCATATYEEFSEDIYFNAVVENKKTKSYDEFVEDVDSAIQQMDRQSKTDKEQILPTKVDGVEVSFIKARSYNAVIVISTGLLCAFLFVFVRNNEIDEQCKKREEELERDYPKILNQYALYYYAGMNPRSIWSRICKGYLDRVNNGGEKSCPFEEMIRTERELSDGVSEIAAYEAFAIRCGNIKYRSFVNLIEQSSRKGNERLNILLEEEAMKAQREENNRVRMLIQEMSTKLLFPMLMMLFVVLVIVMVPAFMSLNN